MALRSSIARNNGCTTSKQLSGVLQPRLVEDFRRPLKGHRQEDRRGGFNGLRVQPLDDVGDVLISQRR